MLAQFVIVEYEFDPLLHAAAAYALPMPVAAVPTTTATRSNATASIARAIPARDRT